MAETAEIRGVERAERQARQDFAARWQSFAAVASGDWGKFR
jgi:hypothetical protein